MRMNALWHDTHPANGRGDEIAHERKIMIGVSLAALLLSALVGFAFHQVAGLCAGVGTLAAFVGFVAIAAAIPAHHPPHEG